MSERAEVPSGYQWHDFELPGDRRLEVLTAGPADGYPLVFHHGTPSGAAPFPLLAEPAAERGLRTITYSRPGYGYSTAVPGRAVELAAGDSAHIVRQLGHSGFVTAGWSGGGPHALACVTLAANCAAAGVLAGPAPRDAAGIQWSDGMAPENIEEFGLAAVGGEEFDTFLETMVSAMQTVATPADVAAGLGELVTDKDRDAIVSSGLGEYVIAAFLRATLVGAAGWRDDDKAFLSDWGLDVSTITKPVLIWHGTEDRMVPVSHGEWLASRIPGAELKVAQGEGHMSLAPQALPDILDFLAKAAGS